MCCDRCKKSTSTWTMSKFNLDHICMTCDKKEKAHPKYKQASLAEHKAVKSGNLNYEGVGKPTDL